MNQVVEITVPWISRYIRQIERLEKAGITQKEFSRKLADLQAVRIAKIIGRNLSRAEHLDLYARMHNNTHGWKRGLSRRPRGTRFDDPISKRTIWTNEANLLADIITALDKDIFAGIPGFEPIERTIPGKEEPFVQRRKDDRVGKGIGSPVRRFTAVPLNNPVSADQGSGDMGGDDGHPVDASRAVGEAKAFFDQHMGPGREVWYLKTAVLDAGPCKPGCYLIVDTTIPPQPQQVVLAMTNEGAALFRLAVGHYESGAHLLIASSVSIIGIPPLLEGRDARIMGAVVAHWLPQ